MQILGADFLTVTRSAAGEDLNKLVGNVRLQQGDTYMSCDSAYINLATNNAEAFGNVLITQPGGTQVQSDYLRYTGNTRNAFLQGNVSLTDGKNNLWSEELTYDVGTKVATYFNGGTLQSDKTTLSSNSGMYNARSKDSRFTGDVMVHDPQYETVSRDLGYNTETRVVTFYDASRVNNDKSELITTKGFWDAAREVAVFNVRSSIRNVEQYIEADTLNYDRTTGFGIATGNVYALDTIQKSVLWSGYAAYNEISRKLWAARTPVLRHMTENDSLFLAADTFFSAHLRRPSTPDSALAGTDSLKTDTTGIITPLKASQTTKSKRRKKAINAKATPAAEVSTRVVIARPDASEIPDTSLPRFYTGYHQARIFSDSLQARCDSLIYSGQDSTMRLIGNPVAWSRRAQITGDTILLFIEQNKLSRLYVPDRAFIVSQTGPDRAGLFDQIQGKTLTAFFDSNRINRMIVFPNAETIYFPTDESGAYLGVNEAKGERMRIFFESQKIRRILFEQDVKQVMTPMKDAPLATLKLSRFSWRQALRPKSREELFQPSVPAAATPAIPAEPAEESNQTD